MIIVKTPLRVSLFGGGTDYPEYFQRHGGRVLGLAIDKYVWTSVRRLPPFFDHRYRVVYSQVETARHVADIRHPAVRAILEYATGITHGVEIHHDADLPALSGMGSSSSFAVGLITALTALSGQLMSQRWVADLAIKLERETMGETGGWQDQIWAACGGLGTITFPPIGPWRCEPLVMPKESEVAFTDSVVLYFTGLSRRASEISVAQAQRVTVNESTLGQMRSMVDAAERILQHGSDLRELGELITDSWRLKRELSPDVTTQEVDELIGDGLRAGAWGGKLLGAGGGGFLMFLCPPHRRDALRQAMRGRIEIRVQPDRTGSKVVLYQPEGL